MEIEEDPKQKEKISHVILCKKWLENNEYFIPIFYLNNSKEIEYKCSKNHIDDIEYQVLTEELILKLSQCNDKEHLDNYQGQTHNYCAWCEKCGKNLC